MKYHTNSTFGERIMTPKYQPLCPQPLRSPILRTGLRCSKGPQNTKHLNPYLKTTHPHVRVWGFNRSIPEPKTWNHTLEVLEETFNPKLYSTENTVKMYGFNLHCWINQPNRNCDSWMGKTSNHNHSLMGWRR